MKMSDVFVLPLDKYNPDSHCFNHYYRYENGLLYWKVKPSRNKNAGDSACNKDYHGYRRCILGNNQYKAHRVIFCMHHGYMPKYIDHINRNRQDNRIENLRAATSSDNNHNKGLRSDNTSGVKGVCWSRTTNKWHARLIINGIVVFSEHFEDMVTAKKEIELQREVYKVEPYKPLKEINSV